MSMPDGVRWIRQSEWPRRVTFEHYRTYTHPHFSLTANVDVARLYGVLKEVGTSFTIGITYVLAAAANQIPEMRQRIRDSQVVEHRLVHPSITVLRPDQTFSFCELPFESHFGRFRRRADAAIAQARSGDVSSLEDSPDRDDYLFLTGIPWVSFTGFQHPVSGSADDAVPRIAWGKFYEHGATLLLPLNVRVHHGLVDGVHVGRFYEGVERLLADSTQWADDRNLSEM